MTKRKRGSKLTLAARREQVAQLRSEKLTVTAIAKRVGVSPATVGKDLQVLGLGTSVRPPATKERIHARALEAVALRRKGLSLRDVGRQLGVSYQTVNTDLARLGYTLKPEPPDIEARQERAVQMREEGVPRQQIAEALGVSAYTVDTYQQAYAGRELRAKAHAQATVADLPGNLWETLELESIGRLRAAASRGSVAAATALVKLAGERAEVSARQACLTHVNRDEADNIVFGAVELIRDRVSSFITGLVDKGVFDDFEVVWQRAMDELDAQYPTGEVDEAAA